jgi:tRNA pseudouridine38-40 synthase
MTTYRLTLEYDGRDFAGWQVQPGGVRSVQGVLEEAIRVATGQTVRAVGAGRTDAGVHAEGQVASAPIETDLDDASLHRAVGAGLPPDVALLALERVPDDFHALRDAKAKLYRYEIWNGATRSPLRAGRSWHVPAPLDVKAMRSAAGAFVGTHDFASFQVAGSEVETTVRTLFRLDVEGQTRGEIRLHVEGEGFLRRMVRALAGTLVEVGRGQRRPDAMAGILAARDRGLAGRSAPAQGLTLVRVEY